MLVPADFNKGVSCSLATGVTAKTDQSKKVHLCPLEMGFLFPLYCWRTQMLAPAPSLDCK